MNNKFLIFLFLLTWMIASGSNAQNLFVGLKSGSVNNYPLESVDKLSFSVSDLIVSLKTGSPVSYGLSTVQKLYFNETVSVGEPAIISVKPLRIFPNPAHQSITIENLPSGTSTLFIYRMDGQLAQTTPFTSETLKLDISGLSSGLYLLFVNGRTAKFLKQ